jgi:acyl carrier protein
MDARTAVLDFFSTYAKRQLAPEELNSLDHCRYLDAGIIDSLGIVMMVTHLEAALGINFSAADMQSYEFQTIGGLIGLLKVKLEKK